MSKISIVMPTFNQEKFIVSAVESILAQTYKDVELVIVNDGSSDNTERILRGFLQNHKNKTSEQGIAKYRFIDGKSVEYIYKPNGGTGSALNEGFNHATGEYETWFSSDNILYPRAIEEMARYLDIHPQCDYVYANCEIGVMDHAGLVEQKRKNIKDEVNQDWEANKLMHHYFLGIVWLWRRELRIKAGPWQIEPCEDYDQVLRMVEVGGKFHFLDMCLGWFRRHGENMSNKIAKSGDRDYYSRLVQNKSRARKGL